MVMAGVEAQHVIGLRLLKLAAGGPEAEREAARMVEEKLEAALQLQASAAAALASGRGRAAPAAAVATLRRKMQANPRRLLKGG